MGALAVVVKVQIHCWLSASRAKHYVNPLAPGRFPGHPSQYQRSLTGPIFHYFTLLFFLQVTTIEKACKIRFRAVLGGFWPFSSRFLIRATIYVEMKIKRP
jgi:hypothetical protein